MPNIKILPFKNVLLFVIYPSIFLKSYRNRIQSLREDKPLDPDDEHHPEHHMDETKIEMTSRITPIKNASTINNQKP